MDQQLLHVAVRWVHVVAMAVALGGAALVFMLALRGRRAGVPPAALVRVAVAYEWAFWAAAGTLVMTGIGNLGAFGAGLPSPQSGWGMTLVIKLSLVALLIALSLPRTVAIGRLTDDATDRAVDLVRRLYGATATALAVIAVLAVWLAHG